MIGGWRDGFNLAGKFTPVRSMNAARVLSGFYYSRWRGSPHLSGLPVSISVEPTTSCNLRCPECPSGLRSFTRPTGMLPPDVFTQVVDELKETLLYLTFYFQGEPYLHPHFLTMVRAAVDRNIYTSTSTNAHYLHDDSARATVESGLDRLIISIDGTTQEVYQAYRVGGNLEKVIEGTERILAWKKKLRAKTPHVVFQFLVVGPNEHQIPDVYKLARKLGVDQVALKTAQIYDYENGSALLPRQQKYSRYTRLNNGKFGIKNKLLNQCWKMWHAAVITWDGKVVPCCFDKDASHVMGDVTRQSFKKIWFGEQYNQFRTLLLKSRSEIEICKNCTEGTRVWA